MKLIPLYGRNGHGKFAEVDDSDYECLMQWRWYGCYYNVSSNLYVVCNYYEGNGKHSTRKMHQVLLGCKNGMVVDHVDGDGLNNQRSNLRFCTRAENSRNKRKYKNGSSKYPGVTAHLPKNQNYTKRWFARIQVNKKSIFLGSFPYTPQGEVLANEAYRSAAKKYFGDFARVNPTESKMNHFVQGEYKTPEIINIPQLPSGAKGIPLTKGQYAIVDEDDYDFLMKWRWSAKPTENGKFVAYRCFPRSERINKQSIRMHTAIMGTRDGMVIDHIDRNPLNNRKSNLRFATPKQNSTNNSKSSSKKSSKFYGVFKHANRYTSIIMNNGVNYRL